MFVNFLMTMSISLGTFEYSLESGVPFLHLLELVLMLTTLLQFSTYNFKLVLNTASSDLKLLKYNFVLHHLKCVR